VACAISDAQAVMAFLQFLLVFSRWSWRYKCQNVTLRSAHRTNDVSESFQH